MFLNYDAAFFTGQHGSFQAKIESGEWRTRTVAWCDVDVLPWWLYCMWMGEHMLQQWALGTGIPEHVTLYDTLACSRLHANSGNCGQVVHVDSFMLRWIIRAIKTYSSFQMMTMCLLSWGWDGCAAKMVLRFIKIGCWWGKCVSCEYDSSMI
jgi:hypothetical protein